MRLSGWTAIADYAKRSEKVVRRWWRTRNFPVVKLDGCVESDTDLIDKWMKLQIENSSKPLPAAPGAVDQPRSAHA